MSEGEEVAHAQRTLAVVDQLPGGVVDGRDVVGVEGVAHAEGVGQNAGTQAQQPGLGDAVMVGGRRRNQTPADDVEGNDGEGHPPDGQPLPPVQCTPEFGQSTRVDGPEGSVVVHRQVLGFDIIG